jgi:uncharacterized membrane protein
VAAVLWDLGAVWVHRGGYGVASIERECTIARRALGIVLLIVLPTARVATMGMWFLFHRDPDFALIAVLVLIMIIASTLLGVGAA